MIVAPGLLKRLSNAGWNVLYKASPVGYAMAVFMTYCAVAAIFEVKPKFAALLAGYGIVGGLYGTQRVGIIGYRLGFGRQFSFAILLVFLVVSSLISVFSSARQYRASRLIGFPRPFTKTGPLGGLPHARRWAAKRAASCGTTGTGALSARGVGFV